MKTPTQYPITVNHKLSLAEMFAQAGYTDGLHIAEAFPTKGTGVKELVAELIQFGRKITSQEVVAEMDNHGLRPATIEELFAFCGQHRRHDLHEGVYDFSILAIGTEADVFGNGRMNVAWHHEYVNDPKPGCGVDLKSVWVATQSGGFQSHNYFLAIHK